MQGHWLSQTPIDVSILFCNFKYLIRRLDFDLIPYVRDVSQVSGGCLQGKELKDHIIQYCKEMGADLVGFAPVERWDTCA